MAELPRKFPEYSIMYKTLAKRIQDLERKMKSSDSNEANEIQKSIDMYLSEMQKIREIFPERFFEDLDSNDQS
ncbi:MAG: hypothetical protein COW27_04240 [Nitrosopumilales archaeon CG15_BIG_FIL_POST_REV_8_21_14_020_37_12]|nr:MAG: hypothetical protein COW27_04240 [Nitrosopumilales archaeon CG15_BIG_FIL_POST_REV_8_21_14_020_37_12]